MDFAWQAQDLERVMFFSVVGVAFATHGMVFAWQAQDFEHVMIFFRGRCGIWNTWNAFCVAGAGL